MERYSVEIKLTYSSDKLVAAAAMTQAVIGVVALASLRPVEYTAGYWAPMSGVLVSLPEAHSHECESCVQSVQALVYLKK